MMEKTLRRLLIACIDPSEEALIVPRGPARRAWIEALRSTIAEETNIGAWDGEPLLGINVEIDVRVDERYGLPFTAHLAVTWLGDLLCLNPGYRSRYYPEEPAVPLAGPAQLARSLAAVRARLDTQARQALRRDKLRRLGVRAFDEKVDDLARRLDFCFYVEWRARWFRLAVELDRYYDMIRCHGLAVFFEIPYEHGDERLAEAERVIGEIRRLRAEGKRPADGPHHRIGLVHTDMVYRPPARPG